MTCFFRGHPSKLFQAAGLPSVVKIRRGIAL